MEGHTEVHNRMMRDFDAIPRELRRALFDCGSLLAPFEEAQARKVRRVIDRVLNADYQAWMRENRARVAGKTACGKK